MVQFFEQLGLIALAIAKAQPFKNRPSKSPDFKNFRDSNGRITDPYCEALLKSNLLINTKTDFKNQKILNWDNKKIAPR